MESAAYCNQILLALLYTQTLRKKLRLIDAFSFVIIDSIKRRKMLDVSSFRVLFQAYLIGNIRPC